MILEEWGIGKGFLLGLDIVRLIVMDYFHLDVFGLEPPFVIKREVVFWQLIWPIIFSCEHLFLV